MTLARRLILAATLSLGLLSPLAVFGAVPPPVPALPDTARLTTYSIVATTCACSVGFALYGDSTDFQSWVEVFINGVQVAYNDATYGWAITSVTGPLATIPRPITDAVLTFTNPQTGTIQIVGARRPRRASQFQENRGVAARDLNQVITDLTAQSRETWDKINDVTGRTLVSQPGVTLGALPLPSACVNGFLGFDGSGVNPLCKTLVPSGSISLPLSLVNGGLGADQSGATAGEVPAYPGSGGSAVPTLLGSLLNTACSTTVTRAACALFFGYANPVWWGADPTATTDSAAACNSALAASSKTTFPPGKFKILSGCNYSLTGTVASSTVTGAGQDATILYFPNATTGMALSLSSPSQSVHVRNLTFSIGVANGGTGLSVHQSVPLGAYAPSDFTNLTFRGDDGGLATDYWTDAIITSGVSGLKFDGVVVDGSSGFSGTGIVISGNVSVSPYYSIVQNFSNCIFNDTAVGIGYGSYVQGMTVTSSNFTGGQYGILAYGSGTGVLSQLAVTNSQFDTTNDAVTLSTQINNLLFSNNFLFIGSSHTGLNLALNSNFTVVGNQFVKAPAATGTAAIHVGTTASGFNSTVIGNTFTQLDYGVILDAAAANVNIQANNFQTIGVSAIANSSTNTNVIANNWGYNPVGVTAAANVGTSPATICAGPSRETHYLTQSATNTATATEGSQQIAALKTAGAYYSVDLGPNECYIVTWTTTDPTYTKYVH
jgi:hypothetical protein